MSKRNRTEITDEIKKYICNEKRLFPNYTSQNLMKAVETSYGLKIGRSTISDILKQTEKWLKAETKNIKRHKPAKYPQLENALVTWLNEVSDFSDNMLRKKAKELGGSLGLPEDFKYSKGWLQKLKKRRGIKRILPIKHDKKAANANRETEEAQANLRNLLPEYSAEDIFQIDDATGLLYRMPPDNTLTTTQKTSACTKDPVTVTVIVSACEPVTVREVKQSLKTLKSFLEENCQGFAETSFACFNTLNSDIGKFLLQKTKPPLMTDINRH